MPKFRSKSFDIEAVQWAGTTESLVEIETLVKAHIPTRCVVRKTAPDGSGSAVVVIVKECQFALKESAWLVYRPDRDEYLAMPNETLRAHYDRVEG